MYTTPEALAVDSTLFPRLPVEAWVKNSGWDFVRHLITNQIPSYFTADYSESLRRIQADVADKKQKLGRF
jgi:hypothetical protein